MGNVVFQAVESFMTSDINVEAQYKWEDGEHSPSHDYLLPCVLGELQALTRENGVGKVFDLGCGNGSVANQLHGAGWDVSGVDASEEGISWANKRYSHLNLKVGSAYDDLASTYGVFPVVVSLEVVEHVFEPRKYASTLFDLIEPGGTVLVSTPYHGYFKNLAMAILGKMDQHYTALWDGGHIKFWSINTLTELLQEAGFVDIRFHRVGRIAPLAKSMVAVARRPR